MKKRFLLAMTFTFAVALTWGVIYLNSLMPVITGYPAKYLCSAVFISNRAPAEVESSNLDFSFIRYVSNEVDYREKSVTSHFLWGRSKAIYRDGFGSTLLRNTNEATLRAHAFPANAMAGYSQDTTEWPLGNIIPDSNTGADKQLLTRIAENLFEHHLYKGDAYAFMVVHKGIPVAENYKKGFDEKTRFLSWSMAKSFTNALVGLMVGDGRMNVDEKADIPAWRNDARTRITLNHLMQMESGLNWNEDYGNLSDVTLMLYNSSDFASFASGRPSEFTPGSHWYYSSGSTNIVNYLIRKRFSNDAAYYSFAHTRLFNKTGMPGAVFETDPSGTQAGSSYIYATARDYARFGLLYLGDGVFNGERVLPKGWVAYTTTPAQASNNGYGSFFWLNRGKYYPAAPADMFSCNGHDGQRIFIIPSRELVVVVLGYSPKPGNPMDFNRLLEDVIGAVKK